MKAKLLILFALKPEFQACSLLHSIAQFGLFFVACVSLTAFASPQESTAIENRFRQATEAMRIGQLDEAGKGFADVVAAQPSFAEAYLNLGLVREEQGRNDEALTSFKKALQLKPRLRGANLFSGIAQYRLNRFVQAVDAIRKEIAIGPTDANAWMWLGVVQLAQEKPEEAVVSLDKAAKLAPNNPDILYHRGRAHLLVSKDSYEQMFKADPNSWRVHQVLAQADAEAERHNEAIAEYLTAIQLVPHQPGLHEELGTEYLKAGKMDEAADALQQELEIDPNNILASYKLGTLEGERGEGAKSKALIENALRQNPSLKDSSYYLGRAEMELGNNAAAAEAFLRETSAPDASGETVQQAWYQLGIVYRRLHRIDDAQKAFATFQKLKDDAAERLHERVEKRQATQPKDTPPQ